MTARERVVVTGVGVVSGAFTGGSPALGAWLLGPSGPAPATGQGPIVDDGTLAAHVDATESRRLSRVSRLAVAAARLALTDAGLDGDTGLGLVVGTELGDLRSTMAFADGYLDRGPAGLSALLFPSTVMNTMASATSIAVRAQQASLTLNAPDVAGELSVARGAAAVASGRMSVALAGGVDELAPDVASLVERLGPRGDRRGEGATFVVLESRAAAERRRATILAEIAGWAWRSAPARPNGVGRGSDGRAVASALSAAGCGAADLRWLYRSASGDPARDRWEERVLTRALGASLPSASLATWLGRHSGLGALRVAAAAWTARSGLLPSDGGGSPAPVERGPGLVHGLARGGAHVALVVTAP